MNIADGIIAALKEALAYERGEIDLPSHTIGQCDRCGHHINFSDDGKGYCPICDREILRIKE